jgi:hypothetical protein
VIERMLGDIPGVVRLELAVDSLDVVGGRPAGMSSRESRRQAARKLLEIWRS